MIYLKVPNDYSCHVCYVPNCIYSYLYGSVSEYSEGNYYQTISLGPWYVRELIINFFFRLLIFRLLTQILLGTDLFTCFSIPAYSVSGSFCPFYFWAQLNLLNFFLSYFCLLLWVRNLVFIARTQITITWGWCQISTVIY